MGLLTRFLRTLSDGLSALSTFIDDYLYMRGRRPSLGEFDQEFACGECDCSECVFGDCCFDCECEMCEEDRETEFEEFENELDGSDDDDDDDDWNILRFVQ